MTMATTESEIYGCYTDNSGSLTELNWTTSNHLFGSGSVIDYCDSVGEDPRKRFWLFRWTVQCMKQYREPSEQDATEISRQLSKLEQFVNPEATIIRDTSINKVLKEILKLDATSVEDRLHIKRRAHELLQKLEKILDAEAPAAPLDIGISISRKTQASRGHSPKTSIRAEHNDIDVFHDELRQLPKSRKRRKGRSTQSQHTLHASGVSSWAKMESALRQSQRNPRRSNCMAKRKE
jgi:hypothetical protein